MAKSTWKQISPAKAAANKANALASTGPRTDEGKHISAVNATTHGLTSKQAVLRGEDPSVYEEFRAGMRASFQPTTEREIAAFEEYVLGMWKLRRCRRTEPALLDECMRAILEADTTLSPDQALARVFCDAQYQKKISLFLRYQTAIERSVAKAHKELLALLKVRHEAELLDRVQQRTTPPAPRAAAAGPMLPSMNPQSFPLASICIRPSTQPVAAGSVVVGHPPSGALSLEL